MSALLEAHPSLLSSPSFSYPLVATTTVKFIWPMRPHLPARLVFVPQLQLYNSLQNRVLRANVCGKSKSTIVLERTVLFAPGISHSQRPRSDDRPLYQF